MAAGHGCLAEFQGTECLLSLHRILVMLASVTALSLSSAASSGAGTVTLAWTAPGEDSLCGRAYRYDLRFSEQPITPQTFQQATPAQGLPTPTAPGTIQSFALEGLKSGVTYYFAIKTADQAGNWSAMSNVIARLPQEVAGLPEGKGLAFSAPWPNPARAESQFSFSLPEAAQVRVEVFDVTGRVVRLLADGPRSAGTQELRFNNCDDRGLWLAPGVYLVRARLGSATFTRRLVISH
jgi:hypothetical protein